MRKIIEIKYTTPTGATLYRRTASELEAAEFKKNLTIRGYKMGEQKLVKARKLERAIGETRESIDY